MLTALVGAVMCVAQRHIKRLLAFSTISHTGMFLIGLGLLTPAGLAASGEYVLEHALLKGALFMAAGILLHRFGTVDEHELRGRGRSRDPGLRVAAIVFALGGLGLAALPPFGVFFGKSALEGALMHTAGYGWVLAVLVIGSALTAGRDPAGRWPRVRRLGRAVAAPPRAAERLSEQPGDAQPARPHPGGDDRRPRVLLLLGGMLVGLWSGLRDGIAAAAAHMTDRAAYVAACARRSRSRTVQTPHAPVVTLDFLLAAATVVGALAVAGLRACRGAGPAAAQPGRAHGHEQYGRLRRLHSGCVNDYIAWLVAGLAVIGVALALT